MTERIRTLLNWIVEGEHKTLRAPLDEKTLEGIRAQIQREDMPLSRRAALRLRLLLENERINVRADERIPGIRTIPEFPDIYARARRSASSPGISSTSRAAFATFPPITRAFCARVCCPAARGRNRRLSRGAATETSLKPPSRPSTR